VTLPTLPTFSHDFPACESAGAEEVRPLAVRFRRTRLSVRLKYSLLHYFIIVMMGPRFAPVGENGIFDCRRHLGVHVTHNHSMLLKLT